MRQPPLHIFLLLCTILASIFPSGAISQQVDSVQTASTQPTAPADTLKKQSDLEGPVKYSADQIAFSMDRKKTYLKGNVRIKYLNMSLEAGQVVIDWEKNYMVATGLADSTDSLGQPIYHSLPVFSEKGEQPIYGHQLEYDFKHKRGKVLKAKTEMEPGYYKGDKIVKIGEKTLLVRNGYFTSCDSIDHPHYYFKAHKMRILMNKRAVAKPIVLYIADVPVFAVPFGAFSMERGRRSGIILPTYGTSDYGGNYLRNFGYYWAASQYWDATLLASFYERTGVTYNGEIRYKKRYNFDGYVRGLFAPKDVTTGQKIKRWNINFSHRQKIGETLNITGYGTFQSDRTFMSDFSNNLNDRLNQVLTTNVTISKTWPSHKNSMNININRTENLQTGNLDYVLPRITFSHTQSSIFPLKSKNVLDRRWYHNIYFSFNSNFLSRGNKTFQTTDSTYLKTEKLGWQHTGSLSFSNKLLRYFKANINTSFNELWVPEYLQYSWDDSSNQAVEQKVKGFKRRLTFSSSMGVSTTLYGLFELPFVPLKVIRHKMDPSISFSFAPDFSASQWGYFQTLTDTSGREVKLDLFAQSPFGATPRRQSRVMNIRVNNLFQGKIIRNGEEKKIDLFTLGFGTSYDFLRDSLKWSRLSTSLQAKARRDVDFTLTAVHSFYKPGSGGVGDRNEYVWENGFSLPRLISLQINAHFRLAPPKQKEKESGKGKNQAAEQTPEEEETDDFQFQDNTRDPEFERLKNLNIPWDLSFNFTYNYNRSDIHNVRKTFNTYVTGMVQLTPNWRIQYSANFDLINKQINYQNFTIYRDLHCWEMSFTWAPNPAFSYFTFRIQVKESVLRDLKLTKSSGSHRPYY